MSLRQRTYSDSGIADQGQRIYRDMVPVVTVVLIALLLQPRFSVAADCVELAGRIVSLQGNVMVADQVAQTNQSICAGDSLVVGAASRIAVRLTKTQTVVRIDQNSEFVIRSSLDNNSLLSLIRGVLHLFSREPASLNVTTPYINAAIDGTEFIVKTGTTESEIIVIEGLVKASNSSGSILVSANEAAIAAAGQAPIRRVIVDAQAAVKWALYYPSIGVDENASASTRRAAELLTTGDVDSALKLLNKAKDDPVSLALRSIIAIAQNRINQALELAQRAVDEDGSSSIAYTAMSYVQQAQFQIDSALLSAGTAVANDPHNAYALARVAELQLATGNATGALESAERAVDLNPALARTQTVLGFVRLVRFNPQRAISAFNSAIILDQSDPLPRLGRGLATIRDGELVTGREYIEEAASLDPNNSLIRSYLGKAYVEEKQFVEASAQFELAKALDPNDPTPWFYDAILKQMENQPIPALRDLQNAIRRNDSRAVYRSRLLLDEDIGARGARTGSVYRDLGFEQLALIEGWKSVNTDPGNHSAHRLLADTYASLPRHEIARDSELLQSQLLQPINVNPVQPRLAGNGLSFLDDTGPAEVGFNEFTRVFASNGLRFQADGIAGSNSTIADNMILSGIGNRSSFSLGQFYFETAGHRENNDLESNIYNAFAQTDVSNQTSIQIELRKFNRTAGDRDVLFNANDFRKNFSIKNDSDSLRLGIRHRFTPSATLLASYSANDASETFDTGQGFSASSKISGHFIELSHLQSFRKVNLTAGAGYFDADTNVAQTFEPNPVVKIQSTTQHANGYIYTSINTFNNLNLSVGLSVDSLEDLTGDKYQVNPKLGLTWKIVDRTTLRAAVIRVLTRSLTSTQTLEPTQVAGFNQFYSDRTGAESWRYGIALDHEIELERENAAHSLFSSLEISARQLRTPVINSPAAEITEFNQDELFGRASIYWTPVDWLALSAEYRFEKTSDESGKNISTHRLPVEARVFSRNGFFGRFRATFVDQSGSFATQIGIDRGDDEFVLFDSQWGYRFGRRLGVVTIEIRNLLDTSFSFQDIDLANSELSREREILARLTLSF